jgi:hypothetical protein
MKSHLLYSYKLGLSGKPLYKLLGIVVADVVRSLRMMPKIGSIGDSTVLMVQIPQHRAAV